MILFVSSSRRAPLAVDGGERVSRHHAPDAPPHAARAPLTALHAISAPKRAPRREVAEIAHTDDNARSGNLALGRG
jgi:hypothetical protein